MRNSRPIHSIRTLGTFGLLVLFAGCANEQPLNEVTVVGVDYAFEVPDVLPPGPTAIAFENRGEVAHEMILVRLKEGVTLENMLQVAQSGTNPDELTEGGPSILMAAPGERAATRLLVDLVPGRTYAVACNFRDEPAAQPHVALGQRTSFRVAQTTD